MSMFFVEVKAVSICINMQISSSIATARVMYIAVSVMGTSRFVLVSP